MKTLPISWQLPSLRLLLVWLCLLGIVVSLPGCGGCWQESPQAKKKREEEEEIKKKKKKKAEKPKPDFELAAPLVLPNEEPPADKQKKEVRDIGMRVKPGHWVSASQYGKANNFDFLGQLETFPIDVNNNPLQIEQTNSRVSMYRPASLPKGQAKFFETIYYLPRRGPQLDASYSLRTVLSAARGGTRIEPVAPLYRSMKDYEYFFLVLSNNSDAYAYIGLLESTKIAESSDSSGLLGGVTYYHVSLPKIAKRAPLPANPLTWTMIAYVLWDDLDPAILTQEQQIAMIDWLHFGGQIIVSGPSSLDKLKGSFLAKYLPAESVTAVKLEQAAFDPLNAGWAIQQKSKLRGSPKISVLPEKPMLGVQLKKHPVGEYLDGTGELVVERRVGGGRIVVTAFPLSDNRVQNWAYYDSFFNACLLRKPHRKFSDSGGLTGLQMTWADPALQSYPKDPRVTSTLRFFSRDIGYMAGAQPPAAVSVQPQDTLTKIAPEIAEMRKQQRMAQLGFDDEPVHSGSMSTLHPDVDDWHFNGYHAAAEAGVAGWNDFSGAADASRAALREAAGIRIPQADFVLKVLSVYLVVLVPLNWLVFWLLGRVEWAWVAAPLIAVGGSIAVIRMAQLDIGFARSRTEIAILEVQGGYNRAHLTRYSALYTSLSTAYDMIFDDPSALALPLASPNSQQRSLSAAEDVKFNRDKQSALADVQVASNSAKMIHSEQMFDLEAGIELLGDEARGYRLRNNSQLTLRDGAVLHKSPSGKLSAAYVGELKPKTAVPLKLEPIDAALPRPKEWQQSYVMSETGPQKESDRGKVRLYRLAELATQRLRLNPGDVRLVAWSSDPLAGMVVEPDAAQVSTHCLIIAHLVRGKLPPPQKDVNMSADFKTFIEEPDTDPNKPAVDANGGIPVEP